MTEQIRVCHVVDSVRNASMPRNLATTQASLEAFDRVGILAWFGVEEFLDIDCVELSHWISRIRYVSTGHSIRWRNQFFHNTMLSIPTIPIQGSTANLSPSASKSQSSRPNTSTRTCRNDNSQVDSGGKSIQ